MKKTIHFSFKSNPVWEKWRRNIAGGVNKAEMGEKGLRHVGGLENEF